MQSTNRDPVVDRFIPKSEFDELKPRNDPMLHPHELPNAPSPPRRVLS